MPKCARALLCSFLLMCAPLLPADAQEARQPAPSARPVLFFAAASLQTALNAIAAEWQRDTLLRGLLRSGAAD